jgi:hypothetical protein
MMIMSRNRARHRRKAIQQVTWIAPKHRPPHAMILFLIILALSATSVFVMFVM